MPAAQGLEFDRAPVRRSLAALPHVDARPRQSAVTTALAGIIGNVLEWFDFAVYGYFATDIGRQFFPPSSALAQQLLAFAVFALGFAARPLGSLALGLIGDRAGRRSLLTLSIAIMGVATMLIGVLPTFAQIGLLAPLLLIALRLAQGFSLGAEFTCSMVYTTEMAPAGRRGLVGSSSALGSSIGFILGSGSAWLVTALAASGVDWRWRIPFLASAVLAIPGLLLRRTLQESPAGLQAAMTRAPLWPSLAADRLPIVRTFGIGAMTNAAYYLTITFVVDRRTHEAGAGAGFLLANTLTLVVVLFAKAFGGWLSDHVGRRHLMIVLTLVMMITIAPLLSVMLHGDVWRFGGAQILLAVPVGMALGLQGAMCVELFPLRTRVASMSIGYSLMIALTGGTAPLVSTFLIDSLGFALAPALYAIALGALGLAAMWRLKETNGVVLDEG